MKLQFNNPRQVEAWVQVHGIRRLRLLVQQRGLDGISAYFVRSWLEHLDTFAAGPSRDD